MRYIARFSQLKGDAQQWLVNLTDNLSPPLRKLTGKAGRLPGCPVRETDHVAHLAMDADLVAHVAGTAPLVIDMVGGITAGKVHADLSASALALAQVGTGVYPMNF